MFAFFTYSSKLLNIRVLSYAETTNVFLFLWRTLAARSTAGSMRATTLSRGPSLLETNSNQAEWALAIDALFEAEGMVPRTLVRA